jgi:hypothetical protein
MQVAHSQSFRPTSIVGAQTAISFRVVGKLAPGDSAHFEVQGSTGWTGGSGGILAGSGASWNIDTPGEFTRELNYVSDIYQLIHHHFVYYIGASISWEIMRSPDSSGDSWIGFTDPGITTRLVSASVPAPASIAIWLFGTCAALIKRRTFVCTNSM